MLLVQTSYHDFLTFPGGIIDAGETPRAAALRELKEEVGLELSESDLQFSTVVDRVSNVTHTYQFVFEANVSEHLFRDIVTQVGEIVDYQIIDRASIPIYDPRYAQVVSQWANGKKGYIEEIYGVRATDG